MLENQFIRFKRNMPSGVCSPLPVLADSTMRFLLPSANVESMSLIRLSDGYEQQLNPTLQPISGEPYTIATITIPQNIIDTNECYVLAYGRTFYRTQGFEYDSTVCDDGEELIMDYNIPDGVAGKCTIQFSPDMTINGRWHGFPTPPWSTDVNGYIKINSYDANGSLKEGASVEIKNGKITGSTEIILYAGGNLEFLLSILNIEGELPDCSHSYIWIDNDQGYADPVIIKNQLLTGYSQPICFVRSADGFSHIKYRCNEDAFNFKFSLDSNFYEEFDIQILLHSPQNVQDDKTYVKANGEVVTLYAKYYKEWEGETEYLSAEMHDKIVASLSCDEVYIDGKRVTKSDKYQVDWENYDLDCDGVTKLARATFKVRENTNQRNSNF